MKKRLASLLLLFAGNYTHGQTALPSMNGANANAAESGQLRWLQIKKVAGRQPAGFILMIELF
ncbi:hypothetical protein DN068_05315 [Taibaiella soli]|uniref:Uncharacterized protein n=1 Tax=Taibaiella soli TaxID=1649169 RepID=A0A2W2B191_9BACT|nr:hypothetical protein DN068_05315 [Taibaiella soli]